MGRKEKNHDPISSFARSSDPAGCIDKVESLRRREGVLYTPQAPSTRPVGRALARYTQSRQPKTIPNVTLRS